jgi:hypothetical protein
MPVSASLNQHEGALGKKVPSVAANGVFSTPLTAAAWMTKPKWAIVARADKITNPDLGKSYYARAHSHTIAIKGASHSVDESHLQEGCGRH